jgi:hypothetical protein
LPKDEDDIMRSPPRAPGWNIPVKLAVSYLLRTV